MLHIEIICIGSLKERYWRDACAEYSKRLTPFCSFRIVELPEAKLPSNPSLALIEKALSEEAQGIEAAAGAGKRVPLCIEGERISSQGLQKLLESCALRGESRVSFIIGSSHGLSDKIKGSGERISLSAMTFPHQLARVMLCEQIYRAFQIQNNTKYHK